MEQTEDYHKTINKKKVESIFINTFFITSSILDRLINLMRTLIAFNRDIPNLPDIILDVDSFK